MTSITTPMSQAATAARQSIWKTKRPLVKPVDHKPKVVKTPQPQPPRVEPSTLSPNMTPVMKTGALEGMKLAAGYTKQEMFRDLEMIRAKAAAGDDYAQRTIKRIDEMVGDGFSVPLDTVKKIRDEARVIRRPVIRAPKTMKPAAAAVKDVKQLARQGGGMGFGTKALLGLGAAGLGVAAMSHLLSDVPRGHDTWRGSPQGKMPQGPENNPVPRRSRDF